MEPKVFRSVGACFAGWAWLVFAAVNLADIVIRGRDLAALIAAAVLLLGCGLAYVLALRPRIVADDGGISVHNPLRDTRIPWSALDEIELATVLCFHCAGDDGRRLRVRAWSVPEPSPRSRARARARAHAHVRPQVAPGLNGMAADDQWHRQSPSESVAAQVAGRAPADFIAEQLTHLAVVGRANAQPASRASVSWSPRAITALALPAAALAVLIGITVLG